MKHIIVFFGLLFAALGASGQNPIFINSYRFAAAPAANLLLDDYPNAAAAYSLRKLRTAYTGDCIQVRRVSDQTTSNIGFSGNYLDTATLKTFCASTNCFVRTWYDQSTNARNAIQTVTTQQPQIVAGGALYYTNGKPALNANTSFRVLATAANISFTAYYASVVSDVTGQLGTSYTHLIGLGGSPFNQFYRSSGNWRYFASSDFATNITFASGQRLITFVDNDTNTVIYLDGVSNTTIAGTPNATNQDLRIMGYEAVGAMQGNFQECIFYASDQSSNRTGIESNINSFYNIY